LNLKKFETGFEASLHDAMATFADDLLNTPVNAIQQRAVLKVVAKAFQREIKAIYKDDPDLKQQCAVPRHLTENARKMIFGVYRADLPYYFATKIRSIEDERWRVFFTHRILVFHNHVSTEGKRNMGLDGRISAGEVYLQKSDFDLIPVVARSRPRIRMGMPRPEVTEESEKVPGKHPDGSGKAASKRSISKKTRRSSRKFRYIPECTHLNTHY
jgi:hypothetical protein